MTLYDRVFTEARSYRKPAFYGTTGAQPGRGKKSKSRALRRIARQDLQKADDDERLDDKKPKRGVRDTADPISPDPADKTRGLAGSRSPDMGWDFFGDGRLMAKKRPGELDLVKKLKRK